MPRTLRSKLTYANVMATLALFLALGGSSYAAITLSKNSVRSKHIAKGAVKRSDLGRNAVSSAKVANGSLLAADFKTGQLPAGPKGDKGDRGDVGPVGPTAGAAGGSYDDPPAGPNFVLEQTEISMPTAGRIYVQGSLRSLSVSCNFTSVSSGAGGNCNSTVGLYVDGQPVAKTGRALGGASCGSTGASVACTHTSSDHDWNLFGLSGVVPAGNHQIQLSLKVTAAPNSQSTAAPTESHRAIVGGIALGG